MIVTFRGGGTTIDDINLSGVWRTGINGFWTEGGDEVFVEERVDLGINSELLWTKVFRNNGDGIRNFCVWVAGYGFKIWFEKTTVTSVGWFFSDWIFGEYWIAVVIGVVCFQGNFYPG